MNNHDNIILPSSINQLHDHLRKMLDAKQTADL
jgi:hypothetical protein